MGVLYLLSHIDRGNIGNAKIEGMDVDIGLTGHQYNIASTIFFVPYIIFGTFICGLHRRVRSANDRQRYPPTSSSRRYDQATGWQRWSCAGERWWPPWAWSRTSRAWWSVVCFLGSSRYLETKAKRAHRNWLCCRQDFSPELYSLWWKTCAQSGWWKVA